MNVDDPNSEPSSAPRPMPATARPWSVGALLLWLPAAILLGVLVGGAAGILQRNFAPLGLFPLLVGAGLGLLAVGLMRLVQVGHRPTVFAGLTLAVIAATVAQHYASYWALRRDIEQRQNDPRAQQQLSNARRAFPEFAPRMVEPSPPQSFYAYLNEEAQRGRRLFNYYEARGAVAWASWLVDALLLAIAAAAVVAPALKLPYCSHCGSWYRTVRRGRLDLAATAELARVVGWTPPEGLRRLRYRLLACQAGCEPTGLDLSWRMRREGGDSALFWLDRPARDAVTAILDTSTLRRKRSRQ